MGGGLVGASASPTGGGLAGASASPMGGGVVGASFNNINTLTYDNR